MSPTPSCRAAMLVAALLSGCAALPPEGSGGKAAPIEEIAHPPVATATPVEPLPAMPPATPAPPPQALPVPEPVPPAVVPPQPAREARVPLMRFLPASAPDKAGWAADMASAFAALHIAPSAENYCAAIAVIEQESGFQADPRVPGLNRMVWKEIEVRRRKYAIPGLVVAAALKLPSPDGRSYAARIDALRTEKEMNALFEDMIAELPMGRALFGSLNPIRTGGPMQVSIEFAEMHARSKPYPYPRKGRSLRDEVFSRRGGVYFGIANLLDYPAPYSSPLYRFADYNAGRYSSRNAAFQAAVARLGGSKLDLDGDLLRYADGEPAAEASATLRALLPLARRLGLDRETIRHELQLEKQAAFSRTALYRQVFALADRKAGMRLPREVLPKIRLKGPKIQRRLTTAWFAKRVDGRYRQCLARAHDTP